MSGFLTTHVLDTASGRPAAGLAIELYRVGGAEPMLIVQDETNADGRTDRPILPEEDFAPGTYELIFHVGSYFAAQGLAGGFLGEVPVRFTMSEGHYHVPLLASPFGYSTYRGS